MFTPHEKPSPIRAFPRLTPLVDGEHQAEETPSPLRIATPVVQISGRQIHTRPLAAGVNLPAGAPASRCHFMATACFCALRKYMDVHQSGCLCRCSGTPPAVDASGKSPKLPGMPSPSSQLWPSRTPAYQQPATPTLTGLQSLPKPSTALQQSQGAHGLPLCHARYSACMAESTASAASCMQGASQTRQDQERQQAWGPGSHNSKKRRSNRGTRQCRHACP